MIAQPADMALLLLDTCALIWVTEGASIAAEAEEALRRAARPGGRVLLSPISAWEIGLLVARGRLAMAMEPEEMFAAALAAPGVALAPMPPALLIRSSFLPGEPPRDPADRIIVATARAEGAMVMTRDRAILAYAEAGHVTAVAC